jgi:hypothetical protein
VNVDKQDSTPDHIGPGKAEVQLSVYGYLERLRVLWVIVPKEVASAFEEELLQVAKKYGKIKLHGEETTPPKPARQN